MKVVPLAAVPSQIVSCALNGQNVALAVYNKRGATFMDVTLAGVLIASFRTCLYAVRVLKNINYNGFVGDFAFIDLQGETDPVYTGFGTGGRFQLIYLDPSDYE